MGETVLSATHHSSLYNSRVHFVELGGPSNLEFPEASAFLSKCLWSAYISQQCTLLLPAWEHSGQYLGNNIYNYSIWFNMSKTGQIEWAKGAFHKWILSLPLDAQLFDCLQHCMSFHRKWTSTDTVAMWPSKPHSSNSRLFIWSVTHHSAIWAGLLSTVATTCAPPTDGWAHSDLTILSACTDNLREFCFKTHTRCPTASPGEGKKMSL